MIYVVYGMFLVGHEPSLGRITRTQLNLTRILVLRCCGSDVEILRCWAGLFNLFALFIISIKGVGLVLVYFRY